MSFNINPGAPLTDWRISRHAGCNWGLKNRIQGHAHHGAWKPRRAAASGFLLSLSVMKGKQGM